MSTPNLPEPPRHSPERTCVACRSKRPQGQLLRLTRTPQGWSVQQRRRSGRGVYVCADSPACWQEKKLRRAFGAKAPDVAQSLLKRDDPQPDQQMTT
ncbi:YlxR family protein [Deinococcus sp.]|uniref:YlxR family protein n=1 Tax=Deinococcus sp. TaxID=47478 RepID=UPI0025C35C69|nr:YlxR family protein [Deinococcus sp.]